MPRPAPLALATAGLCLLALAPALAAFPGRNGRVAFQSDRSGNREIYAVDPEGGAVTRLTFNAAVTPPRPGPPTERGSRSAATATATPRSTPPTQTEPECGG